ncbi:MAG: hypothetical protein FJX68_03605 [Alphaproteobacteria bacterium]|nr:hypothetical protein [Alphaproteobacteria bacterium]
MFASSTRRWILGFGLGGASAALVGGVTARSAQERRPTAPPVEPASCRSDPSGARPGAASDFSQARTGVVRHLIANSSWRSDGARVASLIGYERLARARGQGALRGLAANLAHHLRQRHPVECGLIDAELAGARFDPRDYARRLAAARSAAAADERQCRERERRQLARAERAWLAAQYRFHADCA